MQTSSSNKLRKPWEKPVLRRIALDGPDMKRLRGDPRVREIIDALEESIRRTRV